MALGEQTDLATTDGIAPGDAAAFSTVFAQGKPAVAAPRTSRLRALRRAGRADLLWCDERRLRIAPDFSAEGHLTIGGVVANKGASTVHLVKVTAPVFDSQNHVVAVDDIFVKNESFAPGATAPTINWLSSRLAARSSVIHQLCRYL